MNLLYKIAENDLYYVLALAGICVVAFDLGLLIGWLMVL
jgi:hypothetical protein